MYKIGVIGDKDSVCGYVGVGMDVFPVENAPEAAKRLRAMAEDYAVVFITEALASELPAELQRYAALPSPAVIPIPGASGNTGIGMAGVSRSVEQAVGSDILG